MITALEIALAVGENIIERCGCDGMKGVISFVNDKDSETGQRGEQSVGRSS